MNIKKLSALFIVPLLFISLNTTSYGANAISESNTDGIPEVSGDYADPSHPGMRVRVIVHKAKPITTSTDLVCTDPDSSAVTGATGWELPAGTWTYNLNVSALPSSITQTNFVTLSDNVFDVWDASQSAVSFARGSDTSKAKSSYDRLNIVAFGRTSGNALGVTYTRYYTATGLVADVDTILNKRWAWSWSDASCSLYPSTYDAQNILTHEIGHWMGLDDEYTQDYIHNTMFGYGSTNETKKNTLTTGDIDGVLAIY